MISSIWLKLRFARKRPENLIGELALRSVSSPTASSAAWTLSTENRTECGKSELSNRNSATRKGRSSAVYFLQYASKAAQHFSKPTHSRYSSLSTVCSSGYDKRAKWLPIRVASPLVRST